VLGEMEQKVIRKTGKYLDAISERLSESAPYTKLMRQLNSAEPDRITVTGLAGSSSSFILSRVSKDFRRPIVVIMASTDEAEDLYDDLVFQMDEEQVGHFPATQSPPFEFRSPAAEITARRLSTISRLKNRTLDVVVSSVEAIIEPSISARDFEMGSLFLRVGDELEMTGLAERLVRLGFRRVPLVEEIGDFSVRGGLVDFFSPGFEYPVRVEFFGDEIDTIRQFEVSTQRTTARLSKVELLPRREVSITQETIEKYLEKIPVQDADLIRARYINDPELPGLEWLAVAFGQERGCLLDYFEGEPLLWLQGAGYFEAIIDDIFIDAERRRERTGERLRNFPATEKYYANRQKLLEGIEAFRSIDIVPFRGGREDIIDFECREHPSFGSRLDILSSTVKNFQADNITFFIAADNTGQAQRLEELLHDKIGGSFVPPTEVARLKGGFVSRTNKIAILTDHQIFGRYFRRIRKKRFREGTAIQNYTSLSEGDYVVHATASCSITPTAINCTYRSRNLIGSPDIPGKTVLPGCPPWGRRLGKKPRPGQKRLSPIWPRN
jgi:transcription-repair coupling factor (superfamily II helicase)